MEALCDKLLQVTKDGVSQYTLDEGRILYANQGFMNIFNIDGNPEALQGKLIKTLIFDVKTEKKIKTLFLKKKEIHDFEYYFKTRKNADKWLNLNAHIIYDPILKGKTVLAIVKDVTEHKKLENEYVKLKRIMENEKRGLLKVAKEVEEELEKIEQKRQSLVEKVDAGVATTNIKGKLTYVNNALCKMIGYSKEELIGKPFSDFFHPDNKQRIMQVFLSVFKNPKKHVELEHRVIHKNGHIVHVHSIPTAYIYKGQILGFNAIITDITKRKHAEEKQKQNQIFLDSIVENIPDMVFVKDAKELKFKLINKCGENLLGYKKRDLMDGNDYDFFPKKQAAFFTNKDREVLRSGRLKDIPEEPINTKKGERILHTKKIPIYDEKGNAIYLLGISEDITERKKIEEEIQKQKELFENILSSLSHPLYVIDANNYSIILANQAAGIGDISKPTPCYALTHKRDKPCSDEHICPLKEVKKTKKSVCFEHIHYDRAGKAKFFEVRGFPMFDDKGNVIKLIVCSLDITERKNAEENIKNLSKFPSENPNPVIRINSKGTVLFMNKSTINLLRKFKVSEKDIFKILPDNYKTLISKALKINKPLYGLEVAIGNKTYSYCLSPVLDMKYVNLYAIDITKLKKAEEQINKSLREKETLLHEIHHRVKNNMQVISSLFNLQAGYIKNKRMLEIFQDNQNRIKSMALIHERLYQSKKLTNIDFNEYIKSLTGDLFQIYGMGKGNINLTLNVKNAILGIDSAIPCGLIINELISNSLKHAFPNGKKGEIKITLRFIDKNKIELIISDNGVGIPLNLDIKSPTTLGLKLVSMLVDQLQGEIKLNRTGGTKFQIKLGAVMVYNQLPDSNDITYITK